MSTTSAAHHERNRALSNGFCASIITPGVDLNDGLVFPANRLAALQQQSLIT
jgi:hypothetical protein